MTKLHSMPLFPSDFFADTEHISGEAARAYLFLLAHAWIRGAKLPNDDAALARLARMGIRSWRAIRGEVLSFWRLEDGFWHQPRLTKEYEFVRRRASVNSENGRLGGRPKQSKAPGAAPVAAKQTVSSGLSESKAPTPTPIPTSTAKPDSHRLEAVLRDAAGWANDPSPNLFVTGPIEALIEAGASLERDVLPVVRAKAQACRSPNWRFFLRPIREAWEARVSAGNPLANGANGHAPASALDDEKAWQRRLNEARRRKQWARSDWGPAPGEEGCRVPAHLLQPADGDGWAEWRNE